MSTENEDKALADKVLADKGSWDDFNEDEKASNPNEGTKTVYMDTSEPGKYQVRLVGAHIKCRKLFKPYRATLRDEDRNTDPAWKAGFFPSKRFAINVIDRKDGQLKVLEKGTTVFKQFANYKSIFGKNPADPKDGADFIITVTVPKLPNGQPNKLKTEYNVTHLKETPLTKEEIEKIKAQKLWPLTEIYKPTPLAKRLDMWNALPDAAKIAPKKNKDETEETSNSATEEPSSPVIEDDLQTDVNEDLFRDEENNLNDSKEESADLF